MCDGADPSWLCPRIVEQLKASTPPAADTTADGCRLACGDDAGRAELIRCDPLAKSRIAARGQDRAAVVEVGTGANLPWASVDDRGPCAVVEIEELQ